MVHGLLLALALVVCGCEAAAPHDVRRVSGRDMKMAATGATLLTPPSAEKRARLPRPGVLHGR